MKKNILLLVLAGTLSACADPALNGSNPYAYAPPVLADDVPLSTKVVENVYLMPEQITKLIFPKPVSEVSLDSAIVNVTRNPPDSVENYLLLSPKLAHGDINMEVVLEGQTYSFRLLVGHNSVNYRKTYSIGHNSTHSVPKVGALAPAEISTVNLIKMIEQARREPNYAGQISASLGSTPAGTSYLWNGVSITLQDVWHYYKQDVVVLRIEAYNPTSAAVYFSASQIQPYIANTKLDYLLSEQGTKVLLPGQMDVKYLFLQGYSIDIDDARFELKLPPAGTQLKSGN